MKNKICPLTLIGGNPAACRGDCAWLQKPPLGEKHCAILDIPDASDVSDALYEVKDMLKAIGATIAANRR